VNLVIVINDPVVGLGLLRIASFHGYRVDIIARTGCSWLRRTKACKKYFEVDQSLIENNLVNVLQDLGYDDCRYLCLAAGEIATKALARAADFIDTQTLPFFFTEEVENIACKAGFAEICQKIELPMPKTWKVDAKEDISWLARDSEFTFPLLVKAVNMSGSIGIKFVASHQDLEDIISDETYNYSPLVVQKYVHGIDVCLSFLALEGSIELAYSHEVTKSGASFPVLGEFFQYAKRLAKSIDYTGVANLDVRIDDEGKLHLIECNPRFWASSPLSCLLGIDMIAEAKGISYGSPPLERYYSDQHHFSFVNVALGLVSIGQLSRKKSRRFFDLILRDIPGFLLTKLPALRPLAALSLTR
jgi:hypothetical protein